MENCFFTQQKSKVENPNLIELGAIYVPVSAGEQFRISSETFVTNTPNVVDIKEGDATVTYNGSSTTFPVTIVGDSITVKSCIVTAITDCVIIVKGKYNIKTLSQSNDWNIDTEAFSYSPITYFAFMDATKIHGDIKNLVNIDNVNTACSLGNSQGGTIYGELSELGNMLNVTTINLLYNNGIKGSLESLVRKFVSNGRTTGTINMTINSNIVTFNGTFIPRTGQTAKVFSWEPNSTAGRTNVTWDGTTIVIDNATGNVVS